MSQHTQTGVMPSATLAEHKARQLRCFDFNGLTDGERKMLVLPAFDFRGGPDGNYGQHTCELVFAERRGEHVVSTTFYTGWSVDGSRVIMHGHDIGFMCVGLYNHYPTEKLAGGGSYHNTECPFTGGECWGELGSSLYGETILDRLVNEGSAGVWDEFDMEFKRLEAEA